MTTRTNAKSSSRIVLRMAMQDAGDANRKPVSLPRREITPRHKEAVPYTVYATHYFDTAAAYDEFCNWLQVQFPPSLTDYSVGILEAQPANIPGSEGWYVQLELGYAELIDVVIALQIIDAFRSSQGL